MTTQENEAGVCNMSTILSRPYCVKTNADPCIEQILACHSTESSVEYNVYVCQSILEFLYFHHTEATFW